MTDKFCKDCRWVEWWSDRLPKDQTNAICGHPSSLQHHPPNPVTGITRPSHQLDCTTVRGALGLEQLCGPHGKYWEPK